MEHTNYMQSYTAQRFNENEGNGFTNRNKRYGKEMMFFSFKYKHSLV